jgi:hypothetical protein
MVSTRLAKITFCSLRGICAVIFLAMILTSCCHAADVVFIASPGGASTEQEQLEIAANFYGLNLQVIVVSTADDDLALGRVIERDETYAVVIAANALAVVNKNAVMRALHRRGRNNVPLLILGVAPDVDPILLRAWSGGAAIACKRLEGPLPAQYIFGRVDGLTLQLSGLEAPLPTKHAAYLVLGESGEVQPIASMRHDQQVSPTFIETSVGQQKVFVACALTTDQVLTGEEGVVSAFLRVAPVMMFIKHCAGERGWHAAHHYANFTIDDPWLRQPYGYVDYQGLLGEMEKHEFHTTIAFIPWNFDRSQPGVVSLFRNHPERFSIAIHGDNHDHKEFTDYRRKPLAVQVADLKQSLARMEKFQALTGIPYDKVMVFPHSIAPEKTLEALKTYNYVATINSTNVPQDAAKPTIPSFDLRPVTLLFAGFPSISRYPAAAPIPKEFIAINQFLGNPLLFYAHADFFARGISAFDGVADEVNKREPDTDWCSLGEIVRHLYLLKLREDSNYDVFAFSNGICLENLSGRDSLYYVRKQEIGRQIIKSVIVDGQRQPYRLQNGYLDFTVSIPKGNTRCVVIQYENDLELASIDSSKNSLVVYFLRMASDIRDNYLSKSAVGLSIIRFYDKHDLGPKEVLGCVFAFIGICLYLGYRAWT